MTKDSTKKETKKKQFIPKLELKNETKDTIYALGFFLITLLLILGSFGGSGRVGRALHDFGTLIFGYGYFIIPTITLLLGASFLQKERESLPLRNTVGGILFLISSVLLSIS